MAYIKADVLKCMHLSDLHICFTHICTSLNAHKCYLEINVFAAYYNCKLSFKLIDLVAIDYGSVHSSFALIMGQHFRVLH